MADRCDFSRGKQKTFRVYQEGKFKFKFIFKFIFLFTAVSYYNLQHRMSHKTLSPSSRHESGSATSGEMGDSTRGSEESHRSMCRDLISGLAALSLCLSIHTHRIASARISE